MGQPPRPQEPAGASTVGPLTALLDRWREDLAAWAIPERITAAVAESPWVLPRQVFARRADRLRHDPGGPSFERAWEALDPPGSLVDVGSGAGAACLPLAPRTTALTAVDADDEMLGLLAGRAGEAGLAARVVNGQWPGIGGQVGPADVVTCHHVVFNVPDLGPFLDALTGHARRRVIVETAAAHPLTSLNPLWLRFHGLKRPKGPTAADTGSMAELVEVTRRRLCLPPERAGEVEAALVELGINPGKPGDLGSSGR